VVAFAGRESSADIITNGKIIEKLALLKGNNKH
jgi:hypothetical protein